jgi:hypothetical protein
VAVAVGGGWKVTVLVERDAPAEPLTECDSHVEELLLHSQYGLSARGIRNKLKRAGHLWGIATVKRSLAKLKRLGCVYASRKRPKGYWHRQNLPLFRRAVRAARAA